MSRENLLKRQLKRPDVSCDVSGEGLMIQQLLEGVYDKNEIRDMENQGEYWVSLPSTEGVSFFNYPDLFFLIFSFKWL